MSLSLKTIDHNITKAGRLDHRIIGIYSQETRPEDAVTVSAVIKDGNPCVAKALFSMAADGDIQAIYVCGEGAKECCWGALAWFGYKAFPPNAESMFSSDSQDPNSMFIKRSSQLCTESFRDMGKFSPLGKYIVMRPLSLIQTDPSHISSILCFGNAGQIRDLGAMIHFSESKVYTPIIAPWGSGCATFVSYPSGMAKDGPKNTAFLSPMTPEAEGWLPKDILALGIPIDMAIRMADGYDISFAAKRENNASLESLK